MSDRAVAILTNFTKNGFYLGQSVFPGEVYYEYDSLHRHPHPDLDQQQKFDDYHRLIEREENR